MPSDAIVHVVDDDAAARDSLAFLLKTAQVQVHTYESAEDFLERLPPTIVGCVVTDIRMPGLSGVDLIKRLKELGVSIPVVVMTGHGDVPLAVEAMKNGAADFLEKPFDDEVMLEAVNVALRRHQQQGVQEAERTEISARIKLLSNRERQVLDGLVVGHPNKTIAYDLGISARTVEIYRANVMTKMQATSLSDLVRMAMTVGLINSDYH